MNRPVGPKPKSPAVGRILHSQCADPTSAQLRKRTRKLLLDSELVFGSVPLCAVKVLRSGTTQRAIDHCVWFFLRLIERLARQVSPLDCVCQPDRDTFIKYFSHLKLNRTVWLGRGAKDCALPQAHGHNLFFSLGGVCLRGRACQTGLSTQI